jgi:subtilase family serine protease
MQKPVFASRVFYLVATLFVLPGMLLAMACFKLGPVTYAADRTQPHAIHLKPLYTYIGAVKTKTTFPCQLTTPVQCYGPQQIRAAYNMQPLLAHGINGTGSTIVLVEAYQSPTIAHDLQEFDQFFSLSNPRLNIIAPYGLTPFDPSNADEVGWSGEITLDAEWAHVVAPGATIDLVLAKSDLDTDVMQALQYAIDHDLGDIISLSFGKAETCITPALLQQMHSAFQETKAKSISVIASSGDTGAAQINCDGSSYFLSVGYPASDPLVTAVGGTALNSNGQTGAYQGEVAWNDAAGTSGGGFSSIFHRPFYQSSIAGMTGMRGVPDVAYDADVLHSGVLGVWSSSGLGLDQIFSFGGTSSGAPQWAAIAALGDQMVQQRLGFLNPMLYAIGASPAYAGAFHDITSGNNTFVGANLLGQTVTVDGYNAAPGWDPVTGLGSPNVTNLVQLLASQKLYGFAKWTRAG